MRQSRDNQDFLQELLNCQQSLYVYIFKLVLNAVDAQDILQEVNAIILQKQDEFSEVRNFGSWAATIAYYQVLAYRKKHQRDRHIFSDAVVEQLAQENIDRMPEEGCTLKALEHCLDKLSAKDRELIERRYVEDLPSRGISKIVGRSSRAISQALYRIRKSLMYCIENTLASEGNA